MNICTSCPQCGRSKFYYCTEKLVGVCFRAKCGYKAGPAQLKKAGLVSGDQTPNNVASQGVLGSAIPIVLPSAAVPLVYRADNELYTSYPMACAKVQERGVSVEDQHYFDLHIDLERVYVPLYNDQGQLIQYVGRSQWWLAHQAYPRYKYAAGVKVSELMFNWRESSRLPWITIVENTFNAIRYRKLINATTCFGSSLSKVQVELISRSSVRFAIILFDEGAETKAEKAVSDLRAVGVEATALFIAGQPDNHSDEYIQEIVYEKRKCDHED